MQTFLSAKMKKMLSVKFHIKIRLLLNKIYVMALHEFMCASYLSIKSSFGYLPNSQLIFYHTTYCMLMFAYIHYTALYILLIANGENQTKPHTNFSQYWLCKFHNWLWLKGQPHEILDLLFFFSSNVSSGATGT